jgi:hypothetical protein
MEESSVQLSGKKPWPHESSVPEVAVATYYYGFDRSVYPGDPKMSSLWSGSVFWYTGFYLAPAPHHTDTSWMSKRTYLKNLGWGFLPIYIGRQEGDGNLNYAQGQTDADNADSLGRQAGFPGGTHIFLDIETGGTLSANFINYIKGWVHEIDSTNTIYWASIYCNVSCAAQIKTAIGSDYATFWCVKPDCPPSPGCNLPSPAPNPANCGISYALVWQYAQTPKPALISCTGYTGNQCDQYSLDLDLNTATSTNPSNG